MQADKISTLVKAANVSVEAYWPTLFAKLLEKHNVDDLVTNIGSGRVSSEKVFRLRLTILVVEPPSEHLPY